MRVLFVAAHLPPEFVGGAEAVVLAEARAWRAAGHAVHLVCGSQAPWRGQDVERSELDDGAAGRLSVARIPRQPGEGYDLLLERPRVRDLVLAEARAFAANLAHVHHTWTLDGALVRSLAAERPVVLSLHDAFVHCPRFFASPPPELELACPTERELEPCAACVVREAGEEALGERLGRRVEQQAAELLAARALLVPSEAHAERLRRHVDLPASKTFVVPSVGAHVLRPQPTPTWDPDQPLRVLHFGRRSLEKGSLDLVRALGRAAPGRARLVLAGGPAEPAFDARLAAEARDLDLALECSGSFDAARLEALARSVHLAAFPTRLQESYALTLDEALTLGLPVWSSARAARERHLPPALELLQAGVEPWERAFRDVVDHPEALERSRHAAQRCAPGLVGQRERALAQRIELILESVSVPC